MKRGQIMNEISAADLKLGDVIRMGGGNGAYCDSTVRQILDTGAIRLFRPYVVVGDFAYTGGVLVSIGVEDFEIWPNQSVMLVRRNPHPPR